MNMWEMTYRKVKECTVLTWLLVALKTKKNEIVLSIDFLKATVSIQYNVQEGEKITIDLFMKEIL